MLILQLILLQTKYIKKDTQILGWKLFILWDVMFYCVPTQPQKIAAVLRTRKQIFCENYSTTNHQVEVSNSEGIY